MRHHRDLHDRELLGELPQLVVRLLEHLHEALLRLRLQVDPARGDRLVELFRVHRHVELLEDGLNLS